MRTHINALVALCVLATFAVAQIQPVVSNEKGEGKVDWNERVIISRGIGAPDPNLPKAAQRPSAIRAAKTIALRNALETVKGIHLNSSTTVENFMTTHDQVQTNVSGFIQGFRQKGREKYMSDGSVEITMEIPLDGIGNLGEQIYGTAVSQDPSVTSFEGTQAPEKQVFSGLIIDCKGLDIKPALSPKVVDQQGSEIYGSAYVSREWAVKYGMVGYAKDVQTAAGLDRTGDDPGQIKAVKASGQNNTDVVVSDKDAASIRSASENLKFLSQCRVVFVID